MIEQVIDAAELIASPRIEATADSRLEGRILRTLYRKGHFPEGPLANFVHEKMTSASGKPVCIGCFRQT